MLTYYLLLSMVGTVFGAPLNPPLLNRSSRVTNNTSPANQGTISASSVLKPIQQIRSIPNQNHRSNRNHGFGFPLASLRGMNFPTMQQQHGLQFFPVNSRNNINPLKLQRIGDSKKPSSTASLKKSSSIAKAPKTNSTPSKSSSTARSSNSGLSSLSNTFFRLPFNSLPFGDIFAASASTPNGNVANPTSLRILPSRQSSVSTNNNRSPSWSALWPRVNDAVASFFPIQQQNPASFSSLTAPPEAESQVNALLMEDPSLISEDSTAKVMGEAIVDVESVDTGALTESVAAEKVDPPVESQTLEVKTKPADVVPETEGDANVEGSLPETSVSGGITSEIAQDTTASGTNTATSGDALASEITDPEFGAILAASEVNPTDTFAGVEPSETPQEASAESDTNPIASDRLLTDTSASNTPSETPQESTAAANDTNNVEPEAPTESSVDDSSSETAEETTTASGADLVASEITFVSDKSSETLQEASISESSASPEVNDSTSDASSKTAHEALISEPSASPEVNDSASSTSSETVEDANISEPSASPDVNDFASGTSSETVEDANISEPLASPEFNDASSETSSQDSGSQLVANASEVPVTENASTVESDVNPVSTTSEGSDSTIIE